MDQVDQLAVVTIFANTTIRSGRFMDQAINGTSNGSFSSKLLPPGHQGAIKATTPADSSYHCQVQPPHGPRD
eukprot:164188-Pelagomonas_calceolata.AAC.3